MKSFTDHNGKSYSCVVLAGKDTYQAWSFTLKEHLTTAGLIKFVTGQTDPIIAGEDAKSNTEALLKQEQYAQEAKSILLSTMKDDEVVKIIHCKTAREMWLHFERAYGQKTSNAKLELLTTLNSFKCTSASDVILTTNKILAIRGKLTDHQVELDDLMVISSIIRSLPNSFSTFLESWNMFDAEDQTLDKFVAKLLERAKSIEESESRESAFVALRDQNSFRGRGSNRGSYGGRGGYSGRGGYGGRGGGRGGQGGQPQGHPSPTSSSHSQHQSSNNAAVSQNRPTEPIVCNYCKHIGHMKGDCNKLKNRLARVNGVGNSNHHAEINNMAIEGGNIPRRDHERNDLIRFMGDSGCSSHMTPIFNILRFYKPFAESIPIRIGDDSIVYALGAGELWTTFGKFKRVLFVPKLGSSLLSLATAADEKMRIEIDAQEMKLSRPDGKLAMVGKREGGHIRL